MKKRHFFIPVREREMPLLRIFSFSTFPVYSLSIKTLILLAFCRYRYHTSLFDRPDFRRLEAMIENGEIGTVIVKDMSRLGRNYLKTGELIEIVFPENDVRFIAINDNVDSWVQIDFDMTPIRDFCNKRFS